LIKALTAYRVGVTRTDNDDSDGQATERRRHNQYRCLFQCFAASSSAKSRADLYDGYCCQRHRNCVRLLVGDLQLDIGTPARSAEVPAHGLDGVWRKIDASRPRSALFMATIPITDA
jgi:hypothetical protein